MYSYYKYEFNHFPKKRRSAVKYIYGKTDKVKESKEADMLLVETQCIMASCGDWDL